MTTVKERAPGRVTWVDLMTPDIEGARRFYGELFGWRFEIGGPETHFYTMCRIGDDNVAGMGQLPQGAPWPSAWTVYFGTEDADASAARIRELGGKLMMDPMNVTDAGRMAVAIDPLGAAFGLWQPRKHHGAARVDEPGAMAWREVNVRDAKAAGDFYSALFGLAARPLGAPGMTYFTLHLGDDTIGGVLQMDQNWPAEVPAHWMTYFAVDDAESAVKRVEAAGGKVCVPPFDSPHGRIAVINDPWGAVFSIIKLTQAST